LFSLLVPIFLMAGEWSSGAAVKWSAAQNSILFLTGTLKTIKSCVVDYFSQTIGTLEM
jgi:hypothetical protein